MTHNSYISHSEPIFNKTYLEHLTKSVVNYNLRSRILPVLTIYYVYAESLFEYDQLVKILNDFESHIIIKLRERSHSFAGFSNYITRYLIDKYSDKTICDVQPCFACK